MYYIKWLRNFYYVIFYGRFVIVKVKLIWSHDFRGHKLCFISFICAYNESPICTWPTVITLITFKFETLFSRSFGHNHKLHLMSWSFGLYLGLLIHFFYEYGHIYLGVYESVSQVEGLISNKTKISPHFMITQFAISHSQLHCVS